MLERGRWLAAWLACLLGLWLAFAAVTAHATDFLDPDDAFRASVTETPGAIDIQFKIAPGYYLYRERFAFAASGGQATLDAPVYPKGESKYDETFQKTLEVYHQPMTVHIPVKQASGPFDLKVTYQGCADKGLCYPPTQKTFRIDGAALQPASAGPAATAPSAQTGGVLSSRDDYGRIQQLLDGGNLPLVLLVFLGFGLLLTFTPCVLPMVPILSSIIVGQAATRRRAFGLSLAYVLGMAVVNTAIGVAAGLAGQGLTAALQKPWVLVAFAILMLLLALSMFGFYELQLPAGLRARLDDLSRRQQGGRWVGAIVMGALSAVIVSPCVTAPLAAALAFIAQTGDAVFGGAALFALSVGMGIPLLLIGTGAGTLLPRAGTWMDSVKRFFGVLLVGVALWIVRPVLPDWATMLAWAVLLMVCASYLRVFDPLPDGVSGWYRLFKGIGVVLATASVVLMLGVAGGARDPLRPLAQFTIGGSGQAGTQPAAASASAAPHFTRIKTSAELAQALANAHQPVMLDFYADWCVSCKEMERFTFTDPQVRARLDNALLLQADVTANDADDQALLKRFGLFGPPGIIFFDARGQEVAGTRVIGYQAAGPFLNSLTRAWGETS